MHVCMHCASRPQPGGADMSPRHHTRTPPRWGIRARPRVSARACGAQWAPRASPAKGLTWFGFYYVTMSAV